MKIRNSSRITALVLALMMIVPLISVPAVAAEADNVANVDVTAPVWSQNFNNGTKGEIFQQAPAASDIEVGIGGNNTPAYKVNLKATWDTELAVAFVDRSGAESVTAVQYADGREWTGLANYDGSAVVVTIASGSGITGVITTEKQATGNINTCTKVTSKGTYSGSKELAIVEGAVANAIVGACGQNFTTVAREAFLKTPTIAATDAKVFVLETDYYFSSDFSHTVEGRIYGFQGSTKLQIDLINFAPVGDQIRIKSHSNVVDVQNATTGVLVNKEEWVNIKLVVDVSTGYPVIVCFVNDSFAFSSDESSDLKGKTVDSLGANQWNLGHVSRGVQASALAGFFAVDNANIYTSTEGMKLTMWANDVENASKPGDINMQQLPGNKNYVDSTTFAGTDHGKVIGWDNVPYADGNYWLYTGSGHFESGDNQKLSGVTVTGGKATGSVTVGGTTYYFKDATVCTTSRTQVQATMYTDANCTQVANVKYYICNGAVANAYTGGCGGNVASTSQIRPTVKGQRFTLSADYFFAKDLTMKGMDIRMDNSKVHFFGVGSTNSNATTLTIAPHGDLTRADKNNVINVNKTLTIAKDAWHTFTVVVDSVAPEKGTHIVAYVDGTLCYDIVMLETEMTQVNNWNIGHTLRNGNVNDNSGHWYADNFAIYYGNVVPAEWKATDSSVLWSENFELNAHTAIGKTINYAGTLYSSVDLNGNTAIRIETDTLKDDNDQNSGIVANLDKNFIAQIPAVSYNDYDSVVLEASYYLEPNSRQQIEAQLRKVNGNFSTTFGEAADNNKTKEWAQLYTIVQNENYAYVSNWGSSATGATPKTTAYNSTLPTGRWFTVSTVIDLDTGAMKFYVDGVLAAETYLYTTTGGENGWMTDITLQSGSNGFIVAKLNSLKMNNVQTGWNNSWKKGYSGYFMVDDLSLYTGTAPKNLATGVSEDFSDAAIATDKKAISGGLLKDFSKAYSSSNTISQPAPSLATYSNEIGGNWAVKFDMKGTTAPTTLATPFVALNSRAHDITTTVESFEPFAEINYKNLSTLTKSSSDKPIYYARVGDVVHIYNKNGVALTEDNATTFTYTKVTLNDNNYNAMLRAMCAGSDANIDKNYYLSTPALTQPGTYVLSADYYIPANAGGLAQGQMFTNWVDLYRFDFNSEKFCVQNDSNKPVADLLLDAWNNVTMLVTVAAGKDVVFEIYFNGVYTHTVTKAGYQTVPANNWIIFKATKPVTINAAASYSGNVYVDNVQFNAVAYDANNVKTVNASQVVEWNVDGIVSTNYSKGNVKLYVKDFYKAVSADEYFAEFAGIVATEDVASIRLTAPTGLRFATEIDLELLEALKAVAGNVTFGTLIAPLDNYTESELTFEALVEGDAAGCIRVKADDGKWFTVDKDDATTHFVGSIVNIKDTNLNRAFSGRGYVEITLANGNVYHIYSEAVKSISVSEQAQLTLDKGIYAEGSDEYEILQGFIVE